MRFSSFCAWIAERGFGVFGAPLLSVFKAVFSDETARKNAEKNSP